MQLLVVMVQKANDVYRRDTKSTIISVITEKEAINLKEMNRLENNGSRGSSVYALLTATLSLAMTEHHYTRA